MFEQLKSVMLSRKGQAPSLVAVVVGGVLALIIGVIIIYAVGFPILTNLNSSGVVPASQNTNFSTVLTLLGVTAIIVALVVFMVIARLAS
jgi:energy-converting hydrogenase Eha subunit A